MKKFLKHVFLFFAPVAVLLVACEWALRCIPNDAHFRETQLQKHKQTITTLILGDSHPYFGINPEYINQQTFNLAAVSETPDLTAEVLKHEINRLPKLKTLVVGLSYFSLYESLNRGSETWRLRHYNIYRSMQVGKFPQNHLEIASFSMLQNIDRLLSYYAHDKSEVTCNAFGAGVTYRDFNSKRLRESAVIAAKRHTFDLQSADVQLQRTTQRKALQNIVSLAAKHNIKVVFVLLPAMDTYRELIPFEQKQEMLQVVQQLQKINTELQFLDFTADPRFVPHDFYDADHLNAAGAQKMSSILAAWLAN